MELETQIENKKQDKYHQQLKQKMDELVHLVYKLTRSFPNNELYGSTSQLRRAALSIVLNYIEGFARIKNKVHKNFLEISYGSLKEVRYLLEFSLKEGFINKEEYSVTEKLCDDIGAMLWGIIRKL